ncbi:hypothetical protein [Nocardia sp. NBC_01327]|uniref:hypothetical protein n=1 Tax=Nocardia sp. NBC_01327 TaxID=2903593 RepID=UPI002E1316FA|nr:hypothetical protein OG326_01100 [Nocardia sp. NBC_01327]
MRLLTQDQATAITEMVHGMCDMFPVAMTEVAEELVNDPCGVNPSDTLGTFVAAMFIMARYAEDAAGSSADKRAVKPYEMNSREGRIWSKVHDQPQLKEMYDQWLRELSMGIRERAAASRGARLLKCPKHGRVAEVTADMRLCAARTCECPLREQSRGRRSKFCRPECRQRGYRDRQKGLPSTAPDILEVLGHAATLDYGVGNLADGWRAIDDKARWEYTWSEAITASAVEITFGEEG